MQQQQQQQQERQQPSAPAANGGDSPDATPRQGGSDGELGADEGTPSTCSGSSSCSDEGGAAADSAYFRVQSAEPNRFNSLELQGGSGGMAGSSTWAAAAEADAEAGRPSAQLTPPRLAPAGASAGSAGAALDRQPTAPAASFELPQQQQQATGRSSRDLSVPLTGGLSAADRELLTPDKIAIQGVEQPGEAEAGVWMCPIACLCCLSACVVVHLLSQR